MTQLLNLANTLRSLSDDELVRLLRLRGGVGNHVKDFFDLADWLLQPKNFEALVSSLPRSALEHASGGEKTSAPNPLLDYLAANRLVNYEGRMGFAQEARNQGTPGSDSAAGIHAFETLTAIKELLIELEHRILKDVGKQGIALADAKRLAALTGKDLDFIRACFELAVAAGLLAAPDGRWVLTQQGADWPEQGNLEKWMNLAKTWLELLGFGSTELEAELRHSSSLVGALVEGFPLEKFDKTSRFGHLITYAELLGLSVNGQATSWVSVLLTRGVAAVAKQIDEALPASQDRIIIQSDLSIIAPGPLSAKAERELRAFVDIEQSGIASRYRLSALSISFGMEAGLTSSDMRQTLESLSGRELPQPVDYLINEGSKRFGRIRIMDDGRTGGCFVISTEPTLLAELAGDVRLKPYNLVPVDSGCLASRFSRDILYFGLRELGLPAIRTLQGGEIVSPIKSAQPSQGKKVSGDWLETVHMLRERDAALVSGADDESILRQILLAIKGKNKIQVTYSGQNDEILVLDLVPSQVANGRMRALDRKADIERTIPLDRISAVSFI